MPSLRVISLRSFLLVACLVAATVTAGLSTGSASTTNHSDSAEGSAPICARSTASSVTPAPGSGNLSVETFVAPGQDYTRLRNASALAAARERGTLSLAHVGDYPPWADEVVAYNDTMVHRITMNGSESGILNRLGPRTGESPTAAFRALVASGEVDFDYMGASACPPMLALNATIDRGALRVVPDRANDTLSLVLDTDRLLFDPLGGGDPTTDTRVRGHNGFSFGITEASGLVAENVTVHNSYEVDAASARFTGRHDGLLRVAAAPNQTVRGKTNLAPGTEITVSLRPTAADGAVMSKATTVNRTRGFVTEFDISSAPDEAIYTVSVRGPNGRQLTDGPLTLVAVGNATGAIVDASDQISDGRILYQTSLATTEGGFLTVRNESDAIIGVSEYLEPGATSPQIRFETPLETNQSITVTVYRDANGNREYDDGDVPYRMNGSTIGGSAIVRLRPGRRTTFISTPTWTEPPTSRGPSADETTLSPGPSPTGSARSETSGQPGFEFEAAALALICLIVASTADRRD